MEIFVAKLSFDTQTDDLRRMFEDYGEVYSAKIIMDRDTGRSKGFGFIEMPNDDDGYAAITNLNDATVDGRNIVVKKAEPRADARSSHNNRGGGGNYNRGGGGGGYNSGYNRKY